KPDDMIMSALNTAVSPPPRRASGKHPPPGIAGGESMPPISFEHVIWSPDGQRLAVTFELAAHYPSVSGVVLVSRDGEHVQIFLYHHPSSAAWYTEWDLDQAASTSPALLSLPPALAYQWGKNGALVPVTLLTHTTVPGASPLDLVGNPDGSRTFSIWQ